MIDDTPIPVAVLTGFLGSGKTSLLNSLLKDPMLANACVIINEFGEIGIDHLLVEKSDDNIVELAAGCLCCTIRGDLITTIADLLARRDAGSIKAFDRIVIETTGLADPAPVLHALMRDPLLLQRLRLAASRATTKPTAAAAPPSSRGRAARRPARGSASAGPTRARRRSTAAARCPRRAAGRRCGGT